MAIYHSVLRPVEICAPALGVILIGLGLGDSVPLLGVFRSAAVDGLLHHQVVELELHRQVVGGYLREEGGNGVHAEGVPVVVGLHPGVVYSEFAPIAVARRVAVRNPADALVELVDIVGDRREHVVPGLGRHFPAVIQGAVYIVSAIAADTGTPARKFLAHNVEASELDVLEASLGKAPAGLVDIPVIGLAAVFGIAEIQLPVIHLAPISRGR